MALLCRHRNHTSKIIFFSKLMEAHQHQPLVLIDNFIFGSDSADSGPGGIIERRMSTKSKTCTTPVSTTASPIDVEDIDQHLSSKLFSFCRFVKLDKLNETEKHIHERHLEALKKGDEMYEDPATGYSVLTRLAHLRRGSCCGNACRHCPFSQTAVPKGIPKKTFNSAFFV